MEDGIQYVRVNDGTNEHRLSRRPLAFFSKSVSFCFILFHFLLVASSLILFSPVRRSNLSHRTVPCRCRK